jgi:serine protease Do
MEVLQQFQSAVEGIVERVGPAVVGVGGEWSLGSGVVVADGQVLTNAHNVRGDAATVTFGGGRSEPGRVVGIDPDGDVAALAVDTAGVLPVEWPSDAGSVRVGTPIFALANPGGRGLRVTVGFVSATGQSIRGPRGRMITGIVEHTAPLPRGSSGGPVVDGSGRLVGLNTVRLEGGLILALGADASLRARAEALWRGEAPVRRRLGLALAPAHVSRRLRRAVGLPEREGLLVQDVEEKGAAGRTGVRRGDLIVGAGERDVRGIDDLYAALDSPAAGAELTLKVLRGAEEQLVAVRLEEETRSERAGRRRRC